MTDVQARRDSSLNKIYSEQAQTSIGLIMKGIPIHFLSKAGMNWMDLNICKILRAVWRSYNILKSDNLFSKICIEIARIIALYTKGGSLPSMLKIFASHLHNPFCISCLDTNEKESVEHFLCQYPAFFFQRPQRAHRSLYRLATPLLNKNKWIWSLSAASHFSQ